MLDERENGSLAGDSEDIRNETLCGVAVGWLVLFTYPIRFYDSFLLSLCIRRHSTIFRVYFDNQNEKCMLMLCGMTPR